MWSLAGPLAAIDTAAVLTFLGILMGAGGAVTTIIAQRGGRRVEEAKNVAVANQQELDAQRYKLEGWDKLAARQEAEITRLTDALKYKDEVIEAKDAALKAKDDIIALRDGHIRDLEAKIRQQNYNPEKNE